MPASHSLLSRRPVRAVPSVPLLSGTDEIVLSRGRVHEAAGPARRTFAMWLAAQTEGPVIWIAPPWSADTLNSDGACRWINPARLLFVSPKRGPDLLWSMEEVLRSGAVGLVVADLPALPSLTQVRRMHLAAETGGIEGTQPPLGLLLTPGDGGAPGVETRWHLHTRHENGRDNWALNRVRARTAPQKTWHLHRSPGQTGPRIRKA